MKLPMLTTTLSLAFTLSMAAQSAPAPDMHHDKPPAAPSTTLAVSTGQGAPLTFAVADLQALPQQTITVHNAHTKADETYTGPLVSDVIAKAGLAFSDKSEHPMLRMYLIATGTDDYFVVYSAAEVQPGLHRAKVIVAIAKSGQPLGVNGQFQLIDSGDVKPARWVRNLNSLMLHTAAP